MGYAARDYAGISSWVGGDASTEFRVENSYSSEPGWMHYVLTMTKENGSFAAAQPNVPRSVYNVYLNGKHRGQYYGKYHTVGQVYDKNIVGANFVGWLDDVRVYDRVSMMTTPWRPAGTVCLGYCGRERL